MGGGEGGGGFEGGGLFLGVKPCSLLNNYRIVQVVVRAKRAQLLVFVELARSVQIQIKHIICM